MMAGRAFVSRFSPNRTDPAVLEAIFVQRHSLADSWLERLRDSVLGTTRHHLLAIGPRGCGKSHLVVLLISRLKKDPGLQERVRIAWLPEDETTPSFWKFLLRILRALNAEYGEEFSPPPRKILEDATEERRAAALIDYLLKRLKKRTLLVVVENVDDVMRGLRLEGQKRWRAFLQENKVAATLATAQQLTKDISDRDRPFFNFFQIEHLRPLSADEALSLLKKLADHGGNTELAAFLQTPTGRARVRAIRHITGGSHRIFIILSEFATQEKLDDLVIAFEELLDELTPYYQGRLRWLPDQQREIVEFLCRQTRTVAVKEIAGELYLSEQAAAAQLKGLKDKGYVTAASIGRESRYELAEPLMRMCLEVKDPQREPIRLIVEFLRVWYDRAVLEERLRHLRIDADLERRYFLATLKMFELEGISPVDAALIRDLETAQTNGNSEEVMILLTDLATTSKSLSNCVMAGKELLRLESFGKALKAFDRAILLNNGNREAWKGKGFALYALERDIEALSAFDRSLEIDPTNYISLLGKADCLDRLGRHEEALTIYTDCTDRCPDDALPWFKKGIELTSLSRFDEALIAYDQAIRIDRSFSSPWINRATILWKTDRIYEAIDSLNHAIGLDAREPFVFDLLASLYVINDQWDKAKELMKIRFGLHSSQTDESTNLLNILLANMFLASFEKKIWLRRFKSLVTLAKKAQIINEEIEPKKQAGLAGYFAKMEKPPRPVASIGDALVKSLKHPAYRWSRSDMLEDLVIAWKDIAEHHPELSLAVRLFEVGIQFVQTRNEKVLLDLVQEERQILHDLFNLDDPSSQEDEVAFPFTIPWN